MKTPKVSVIIPVYNVEKYLTACLDSVVNQTLKEIEILVVNDGSPDNSQEIIDRYAVADPRVIPLKKTNGGLSSARNFGMTHAQGDYIFFLDSDDYIELNTLETLYAKAHTDNLELTFCKVRTIDAETEEPTHEVYFGIEHLPPIFKEITFGFDDFLPYLFQVPVVAWNKLYSKDYLTKIKAQFYEGYLFEDNLFFFTVMVAAQRIGWVDSFFYNHRTERKDSIINNIKAGKTIRTLDCIEILSESYKVLKCSPFWKAIKYDYVNSSVGILDQREIQTADSVIEEYQEKKKNLLLSIRAEIYDARFLSTSTLNTFKSILSPDDELFHLPNGMKEKSITVFGKKVGTKTYSQNGRAWSLLGAKIFEERKSAKYKRYFIFGLRALKLKR